MPRKKPPPTAPRSAKEAPPPQASSDPRAETDLESSSPPVHPVLPIPVVGIGASAGGVEASSQLLQGLPQDTGMAFVLIQHLSPGRVSMLSEILGRATAMPVQTVENGMRVEPNKVYVIPPGSGMELSDGKFKLSPRERTEGTYRPIDQFFRSLAQDVGDLVVGSREEVSQPELNATVTVGEQAHLPQHVVEGRVDPSGHLVALEDGGEIVGADAVGLGCAQPPSSLLRRQAARRASPKAARTAMASSTDKAAAVVPPGDVT